MMAGLDEAGPDGRMAKRPGAAGEAGAAEAVAYTITIDAMTNGSFRVALGQADADEYPDMEQALLAVVRMVKANPASGDEQDAFQAAYAEAAE